MNFQSGQTDLILPLFEGLFETPLWENFLRRLLARTQAQRVRMTIAQTIADERPALHRRLVARGHAPLGNAADEDSALRALTDSGLRTNRIYGFSELCDNAGLATSGADSLLERARIGDARLIRIPMNPQGSIWVSLLHERQAFQAADSALLAALAPAIRLASHTLFSIGLFKARMDAAETALARLGIGQAILDGQGLPLAADPAWQNQQPMPQVMDGEMATACAALSNADERDFIFLPNQKTGRPILLRPVGQGRDPFTQPAVAVASYRLPHGISMEFLECAIAATFGLTPRESALAARLAKGHSLSESGELLGLTVETVRNYSKRIYAKTAARGQADLIRMILACLA